LVKHYYRAIVFPQDIGMVGHKLRVNVAPHEILKRENQKTEREIIFVYMI